MPKKIYIYININHKHKTLNLFFNLKQLLYENYASLFSNYSIHKLFGSHYEHINSVVWRQLYLNEIKKKKNYFSLGFYSIQNTNLI
jgi:hypothetical protein